MFALVPQFLDRGLGIPSKHQYRMNPRSWIGFPSYRKYQTRYLAFDHPRPSSRLSVPFLFFTPCEERLIAEPQQPHDVAFIFPIKIGQQSWLPTSRLGLPSHQNSQTLGLSFQNPQMTLCYESLCWWGPNSFFSANLIRMLWHRCQISPLDTTQMGEKIVATFCVDDGQTREITFQNHEFLTSFFSDCHFWVWLSLTETSLGPLMCDSHFLRADVWAFNAQDVLVLALTVWFTFPASRCLAVRCHTATKGTEEQLKCAYSRTCTPDLTIAFVPGTEYNEGESYVHAHAHAHAQASIRTRARAWISRKFWKAFGKRTIWMSSLLQA